MVEALVGALLLGLGAMLGWFLSTRDRAVLTKALENAMAETSAMAGRLAMLKGLHPHFADPGRFVPEAISRTDWKDRTEPIETEGIDNPEEDGDDRDEFEASLDALNAARSKARANAG